MAAAIPRSQGAGPGLTKSSSTASGADESQARRVDRATARDAAPPLARTLGRFPVVAAAAAIAVGMLALAGWSFDIGWLKSLLPGLATMKPNTAVAFVLCGAALWATTGAAAAAAHPGPGARAHGFTLGVVRTCATIVTLIGLLTLGEYAAGWQLGIDRLLFAEAAREPGVLHPGRMAPATALGFSLLGIAFLAIDRRTRGGRWPAQWLALTVAFGAFLALLGYAYGVESLYRLPPYSSVAMHTALLFFLLTIGFLCARPGRGLIGLVTRDDAAGTFVRGMLPAAVLAPPLLGWLQLLGWRSGFYTLEFGVALTAAGAAAVFSGLVLWTGRSVRAIEADRIRAAEALLASETRFRATIEAAPVGIVMVDDEGTIVLANTEAGKLFGYSPAELKDGSIERLIPERFRSAHVAWRESFAAAPQMRRMGPGRVLFAVRRDGSEFPAEIGLSPVVTARGAYVIATILDITATRRTEAELREHASRAACQAEALQRANEALERSNLALQEFAYVASHDLQTPLRSVAGFAQLLQAEYAGRLDAEADDWIHRIVDSAKQLQALIQDVLAYSSLEASAMPFEPVAFRDVLDAVVSLLDASIRELNASVTCGELPEVTGDRSQLVRLLQNLIANALKYRGEAPPCVHVSAGRGAGEWIFAVRDNGIGIDARHHGQIFDMFQRLHDRREYPGTGIGLAVCRNIVERHGGRIWVESAPGRGSTFHFTMPDRTESVT